MGQSPERHEISFADVAVFPPTTPAHLSASSLPQIHKRKPGAILGCRTAAMQEQDLGFDMRGETSPLTSEAASPNLPRRRKTRVRNTTACNACRARRTKCDSRRPECGYCHKRGLQCYYDPKQPNSAARVEDELAAIHRRLDFIASSLPTVHQPSTAVSDHGPSTNSNGDNHTNAVTGKERSPFQLLLTDCMMAVLGLGQGFARELVRLERSGRHGLGNTPRLHFLQQHNALAALDSFSAHVHIWYPLLRPGFSERYIRVISGPLVPGPESCLVLAVAAVGALAQQDHALGVSGSESTCEAYLEAAVAFLPVVFVSESIESVQSLFLLSLYHCCLSRPCQAYDYVVIASFKVRNLLRSGAQGSEELQEQAKRCYWVILLLESELRDQLDLLDSGIWDLDDSMALPDGRHTWHFDPDADSAPGPMTATPGSNISADSAVADKGQAYFLAEIAMRRMLHRCYTAIRRSSTGEIAYAAGVAHELELQLDEWYCYLPSMFQFRHLTTDIPHISSLSSPPPDPLNEFLRVQYYCCKISIYWPAAYQCIQDGMAMPEVLRHCERFFNAYVQAMPSLLLSVRNCIVNRWTLYATIFVTSMAVIQAAGTPCIREGCSVDWACVLKCLESTREVDIRIVEASPSLSLFHSTLIERLAEASSTLGKMN